MASPGLKVLHVLRSLDFGGAEKLVLNLASRQKESADIHPEIVCLIEGGELSGEAASIGLSVTVTGLGPIRYLSGMSRLLRLFSSSKPDIIHTHNFLAHVHAGPAGKMLGIPVVHTKHGRAVVSMNRVPWLRRYLYNLADEIVVVSKETGEIFASRSGVSQSRIRVIYNGIDLDKNRVSVIDRRDLAGIEEIDPDTVIFGSVSRLDPVKDHATMLRAFRGVSDLNEKAILLIVGDGPEREMIENFSEELGIVDKVRITGFTKDVPAYLSIMDMFLQPSINEGLSLTILEAAAAGVPIVSTAIGGTPEIIENGVSGTLLQVGDNESLSIAMKQFLRDRSTFKRMAVAARTVVEERFSLESMTSNYSELYWRLADHETSGANAGGSR